MSFDDLEGRCPRLGHTIRFAYCRTCEADSRPCGKVLDCWWERFDVVAYCRATYSSAELSRLSNRQSPDKVIGLLNLIEAARRRTAEES